MSKIVKDEYYLQSSLSFFKSKYEKRLKFLKNKNFLFNEISNFINNCIDETKNIFIFCAGNSSIGKNINAKKIYIKEIDNNYEINYGENIYYDNKIQSEHISECDTILIADIEHQSNPTSNLLNLSRLIKDNAKIVILSKNLTWMVFIKFLKIFFDFSPVKNNFLPSSYLNNLYSSCNLEIVRTERLIAIPIYIPFITTLLNRIFRLPILNIFCLSNVTILKKNKSKF